jgi:hypothetical protein
VPHGRRDHEQHRRPRPRTLPAAWTAVVIMLSP